MPITEDTLLTRQVLAYVIELYQELTEENGAPMPGTQNQVVDYILAEPELHAAVADWAQQAGIDEAATAARPHLPRGHTYERIRDYFQSIMGQPVFARPGQDPDDRR